MQHETPARPRLAKRVVSFLFSLLLLSGSVWVIFNRQLVYDWWVLSRYTPPAAIQALANSTTMTDTGKRLFYVNEPEIRGKETFSEGCKQAGDEKSNVLGCFTGMRIYVFDVTDERLKGVKEVTAAHEMLHAAYMRLGSSERGHVNALVQKQLDTYTDPHIKELIAIYNRIEPGELLNEMHSILATEQEQIVPELEDYFKQYFDDRQKIVTLANQYQNVFDDLKKQQDNLVAELDALADKINTSTARLNQDISALNNDIEAFNQDASSGAMTQSEFTQRRAGLQARRADINNRIAQNDNLRVAYDEKRKIYDVLALDSANLQKSIDSRPASPGSVN